jgi:coenzyme F420 biosynthesis associated uncharacterized protein
MSRLVDWSVAERTGWSLTPAPPEVSRDEALAVVEELRRSTDRAAGLVADLTRLTEPAVTARTLVVDRPGWLTANVASMATVMDPITDRLTAKRPPGRFTEAVGGRTTGAQAGAILAFLSGKVLGQFEFFSEADGQLLLVAPNVVAVEQSLGVMPSDFRLWVCLHEVTHRVQFTAVPWLRQHLMSEIEELTESIDVDPDAIAARLRSALSEVTRAVRGGDNRGGVIAALTPPEAREVMDRVTGFMSLVEGHAEYVMNAVDPSVIPSQKRIEERFAERRRRGGNPLDRVLRSLLGMDAKTQQYTQGSAFVRAVVDLVGLDAFNAVWATPQNLPSKIEIGDPQAWISRVHG